MPDKDSAPVSNFIRNIIDKDREAGKNDGKVHTRFPPEPNGYLHIGHAKSIVLNFGLANDYQGACNLRFDDTNPEKEDQEYIDAIEEDVSWLGYQWAGEPQHASAYFHQLYDFAVALVNKGKAYVCSLNAEQSREYRGTLKEPGKNSPDRERSVEENLDLLARMRKGEFENGKYTLRAKIDMASPNMNMRDPVIYRIRHEEHHQTGNEWCIYPMYDFTHCLSDMLEGITHSLCTLEFEDHRPLYDWYLDQLETPCHPQQIEFARLNLNYTVTSKRKLKQLVDEEHVSGWDDPRMPTITGLRRRGYTPAAIRHFCDAIGVAKADSVVDFGMLEASIRDDLDSNAERAMAVLNPLKVVITNYPDGQVEELSGPRHPKLDLGTRTLKMEREIFIDRNDFEEVPPPKYKRLSPGEAVRLRNAYVIRCEEVIKDDSGEVIELRCSFDDKTLGTKPEGYKPKGVIHWVGATTSLPATINMYDRLFSIENPDKTAEGETFLDHINPESLTVMSDARVEPSLANVAAETNFQFEREGYFVADRYDCKPGNLVFNRTVTLRDSWVKIQKKG